jgi:hypothetical protein
VSAVEGKPQEETGGGLDHADAQRMAARKDAEHRGEIDRIADKNRKTHLAAIKKREAAQRMSAKLRRGLGGKGGDQ